MEENIKSIEVLIKEFEGVLNAWITGLMSDEEFETAEKIHIEKIKEAKKRAM